MRIYLGDKFYKYIEKEDRVEIIRIIKIKNEDSFVAMSENNETLRFNKENLLKEYTKIKGDGMLAFNLVDLDADAKDVIVALYRNGDLESGDTLPYCCCRQNIVDLFSNIIKTENDTHMYVGMSVSKDTIPEDTPYEITLACNGISYSIMVTIYMDDTLDEILNMVKTDKFDMGLFKLYNSIDRNKVIGYYKSLKELLQGCNFMYDFYKAFNIYEVPFKVSINGDYSLPIEQHRYLEDEIRVEMFRTYVMEYSKEIDLKKVERNYIMVIDIEMKAYIIAYDRGEYINRKYQSLIKDKREAITMLKNKKHL